MVRIEHARARCYKMLARYDHLKMLVRMIIDRVGFPARLVYERSHLP